MQEKICDERAKRENSLTLNYWQSRVVALLFPRRKENIVPSEFGILHICSRSLDNWNSNILTTQLFWNSTMMFWDIYLFSYATEEKNQRQVEKRRNLRMSAMSFGVLFETNNLLFHFDNVADIFYISCLKEWTRISGQATWGEAKIFLWRQKRIKI